MWIRFQTSGAHVFTVAHFSQVLAPKFKKNAGRLLACRNQGRETRREEVNKTFLRIGRERKGGRRREPVVS